jgi:hypothetical protein
MNDRAEDLITLVNAEKENAEFLTGLTEQLELGIKNANTKAERAERELELFTQALDIIDDVEPVPSYDELFNEEENNEE